MAEKHLEWQIFGERLVYDNPWVKVGLTDVLAPDGRRFDYHVVHLARIAIAVMVDDQERVLMSWRYRFATRQWGYELFGGLVEEGEEPVGTAAREALEESGWRPLGEPEHLVSFEPLPGQVTAPVDAFVWRGAEKVGDPTDLEEAGRVEWVALNRINELVARQELLGSGTLIPLLHYLNSRRS
jgi:8-oxo-dGTP pyrophosphatase MutT (NUDIX family)